MWKKPPQELQRQIDEHALWVKTLEAEGTQLQLKNMEFDHLDLASQDLSSSILVELSIESTKLEDSDLYRSYLAGTTITNSYLERVVLTKSTLYETRIYRCNCQYSKFIRPELVGATIEQSDFQHADFKNTRFSSDCIFDNVNCNYSNFTGARFFGEFKDVSFVDAVFSGAFFHAERMKFTNITGIDSIIADKITVHKDGENQIISGEQNVRDWFKSVVNNG